MCTLQTISQKLVSSLHFVKEEYLVLNNKGSSNDENENGGDAFGKWICLKQYIGNVKHEMKDNCGGNVSAIFEIYPIHQLEPEVSHSFLYLRAISEEGLIPRLWIFW